MPPEIKKHVRRCVDCRALITRWNAIELRLQTMREETPRLSADFSLVLQARLRAEQCRPSLSWWRGRPWHLALAGASAMLLLAILLFRSLGGTRLLETRAHPAASSLAVARPMPAPVNQRMVTPSIAPEFPLANTTR